MSETRSAGKVAVVTGGGRGLGRAIVLVLAAAGVRVVTTAAREKDEVERVAQQAHGGSVLPLTADVTEAADCERVIATALDRFGRLDVLVNNAGRGMKYVSERFSTDASPAAGSFSFRRCSVKIMATPLSEVIARRACLSSAH